MYSTLEQSMRPRRPKRNKNRFLLILISSLVAVVTLIVLLFSQSLQVEVRKNSERIEYSGGTVLRIKLGTNEIATNFKELETRLSQFKEAGFYTIVLPVIQPSDEVLVGSTSFRAPQSWQGIDAKFGSDQDLLSLIAAAHKNSQKVLLTLTTGWISKSNSWYSQNPNWFYTDNQLERLARQVNIPDGFPEGIAMPGGPQFRSMEYVSVVNGWFKKYAIDGIYIEIPYDDVNQPSSMTLEEIKNLIGNDNSFLMLSNGTSGATRQGNINSAVQSDIVEQVLSEIEKTFNPDVLATSLNEAFTSSYGPRQMHSVTAPNPTYLANTPGVSGDLDLATALAYVLPGIPSINSAELLIPSRLSLFSKLNSLFSSSQKNDKDWSKNKISFFVAGKSGTVGLGVNRNGVKSVIFLNTNPDGIKNADFQIDSEFGGTYKNCITGASVNLAEVSKLELKSGQLVLLTQN